ncbi:MAG TPA: hypothetical protein VML96_00775 [Egibacteraceae bacterium]|nr:hypothetical protein [Egibacteraceae bacterium]
MTEARTQRVTASSWRLLDLERGDARTLVQAGAALLEALAEDPTPVARWYRASVPALVLGRGQGPIAEISGRGLPRVTRHSGGGAVLLDDALLSLDLLIPADHPLVAGSLSDAFIRVGEVWAGAIADLGVGEVSVHRGPSQARRRGSDRAQLLAAICYATLGRGEVAVGGRKLVGLAQRRRRAGALIQCGLLRRWNPDAVLDALGKPFPDPDVAARAVGLDQLVHPAPSDDAVMTAVMARLEAASG